jgi:hypothetical protein
MNLLLCRVEAKQQGRDSSWSDRLWVGMETEHREQTREKKGREWNAPAPGVRHCGGYGRGFSPARWKGRGKESHVVQRLHLTQKEFK